jgi:hypothetical protein
MFDSGDLSPPHAPSRAVRESRPNEAGRSRLHRSGYPAPPSLAAKCATLIDVFEDETLTRLLAFARDAAGTVTGFRLTTDGVADLEFARSR